MQGNERLVEELAREGYLKTPGVVEAFRKVDRKHFVPRKEEAYQDHPLPLQAGQTISAPHMVAMMLELLEVGKRHRVLEVGTGSGYSAALLGRLASEVTSIELFLELAEFARKNLIKAGVRNVEVVVGDGSRGVPGQEFDRIVFACAVREVPEPLFRQLKDPGILMAPVGGEGRQELVLFRKENGKLRKEIHGGVAFVPLLDGRSTS